MWDCFVRKGIRRRYFCTGLAVVVWGFFRMGLGAELEPPMFERLTFPGDRGLSSIHAIIRDRDGFIWLGGEDGAHRYDGIRLVHFAYHPRRPDSLSHNRVNSFCLDAWGNLWVATDKGLNVYRREYENFVRYGSQPEEGGLLSEDEVNYICRDRRGDIWAATWSGGVNRLTARRREGVFRREATCRVYRHEAGRPGSLPGDGVNVIYEDSWGNLWFGGREGVLALYLWKEDRFLDASRWLEPGRGGTEKPQVRSIYRDGEGWLWLACDDGLRGVRAPRGEIAAIGEAPPSRVFYDTPQSAGGFAGAPVRAVAGGGSGVVWVGSYGGGISRFQPAEGIFERFRNHPADANSPGGDFITAIYRDNAGAVWFGSFNGGVFKYDPRRWKFPLRRVRFAVNGTGEADNIIAFYEDRAGDIWIGTQGFGFLRHHPVSGEFEVIRGGAAPGEPVFDSRVTLAITGDNRGKIWVGADGGGLAEYDPVRRRFLRVYRNDPTETDSLANDHVTALYCGREGELWIGSDSGLNRLDPRTGDFTWFRHQSADPTTLGGDYVLTVKPWKDPSAQKLWVGIYRGGLSVLDIPSGRVERYFSDPNHSEGVSDNSVRCVHEDRKGRVWTGTDKGLNQFFPERGEFRIPDGRHPGLSDCIYGILEDLDGELWISGARGLIRFDPDTGALMNYDESDGLQGEKFNHGAYLSSRAGMLYFGGARGFNVFNPNRIPVDLNPPPLVITDFLLFNESAAIEPRTGPLFQSVTTMDRIRLNHEQNYLAFEFAVLDFSRPGKNQYAYKLEPLDRSWRRTGADKRFASYTNLDPGEYVFRVIGANSDGTWNRKGTAIRLEIAPPFWERLWFRILAAGAVFFLLFLGYQYRTRALRRNVEEQKRIRVLVEGSRDEMEKARRLAEWRNAENEKLIAAISSVFIAVDADGAITQWNAAAQDFFGVSAADALGAPFVRRLRDAVPGTLPEEFLDMGLNKNRSTHNIEFHFNCPVSGESRIGLGVINPVTDRRGQKFGFVFLVEDITHRQRREMMKHLSQKLEALGQMAAGAAHEIRTPLQYILDNSRFLQDSFHALEAVRREAGSGPAGDDAEYLTREIPRALDHLVEGVERVSAIVRSMYEFSHPGGGTEAPVQVHDLLASTLTVAGGALSGVADVETDFQKGLPPIRCNGGELNQVFLNLLVNAADAIAETGKRGKIRVSTRLSRDECVVEIADNGVGVPPEHYDKMFKPFFTTKGLGKGTGQGLYFSHRIIVNGHGGAIHFRSAVGEGTTFYIHLPLERRKPENPPPPPV